LNKRRIDFVTAGWSHEIATISSQIIALHALQAGYLVNDYPFFKNIKALLAPKSF